MDARIQVLEAELKTVRIVRLASDPEVARAAKLREKELQDELSQIKRPVNASSRK